MRNARREADVSEDPRPIRISDPVGFDDRWVTFAATDHAGDLLIRVGRLAWERLQYDAPDAFDADDRRDYALGMIEWRAAGLTIAITSDGRALTLPPDDT